MHRLPHDIFHFLVPPPQCYPQFRSRKGTAPSSSMMQKYVRTAQPDFVMPPRLIHPGAGSHILKPPTALPAFPYAPMPRRHDEILQTQCRPQLPATRRPFDTCVSYDPDTTTRHIRHLPDTNRFSSATRVSNPPICVSTSTSPKSSDHGTTKSANLLSPGQTAPCNSFVSYGPATTMLLMRRLSDTNRSFPDTNTVARPYLSIAPVRQKFSAHITTKSDNYDIPPKLHIVELSGPIRPSYGSGTNGTPLRYKSPVHSYKPSSTPYLRWHRTPPRFPPHPPQPTRRNTTTPQCFSSSQPSHSPKWPPASPA